MELDGQITSLAKDIEKLYTSEFIGKFPYKDCYALQKAHPNLTASIIPDLDMYFSFIAGYSSSATRLRSRPPEELRKAVTKLRMSFFDKHPEYKPLEVAIAQTNALSGNMRVADQLRTSLIRVMESFG